jgi:nucleotide-binding universal stress UspA family protein
MLEQKGSGAQQLIRIAHEERADLLGTGAYGHSRLGEWIFGGMTRELLAASPICCLMSHCFPLANGLFGGRPCKRLFESISKG